MFPNGPQQEAQDQSESRWTATVYFRSLCVPRRTVATKNFRRYTIYIDRMAERKSEDISDDMTDTYARKNFGIYARNYYVRIDAR